MHGFVTQFTKAAANPASRKGREGRKGGKEEGVLTPHLGPVWSAFAKVTARQAGRGSPQALCHDWSRGLQEACCELGQFALLANWDLRRRLVPGQSGKVRADLRRLLQFMIRGHGSPFGTPCAKPTSDAGNGLKIFPAQKSQSKSFPTIQRKPASQTIWNCRIWKRHGQRLATNLKLKT